MLSKRKYYTRPRKKALIGLQKYTCHLKIYCTRPGMNFYPEHCSNLLVLPTLKAETLAALPMSNIIRMATAKVDQGGNKSNNVCSLPSQISKISNKISQKINPHKSFKDFDVQNPKRSSATKPPRTATNSQQPASFSFKSAQI